MLVLVGIVLGVGVVVCVGFSVCIGGVGWCFSWWWVWGKEAP